MTALTPSDDAVPHPSRQSLVVPPRQSSWPVAVGAVASAAAGFGLVLFLGIGRIRHAGDAVPVTVAATDPADAVVPAALTTVSETEPLREFAPVEPDLLPPPAAAPAVSRWSAGGVRDEESFRQDLGQAARPASHDESPASDGDLEATPHPLRGSSADLPFTGPDSGAAVVEASGGREALPGDPADVPAGPLDLGRVGDDPSRPAPVAEPVSGGPPADTVAAAAETSPEASLSSLPLPAPVTTTFTAPVPPPAVPPATVVGANPGPPAHPAPAADVSDSDQPVRDPDPEAAPGDVTVPVPPPGFGEPVPPARLPVGDATRAMPPVPPVAAATVPVGLPPRPVSPFAAAPPVGPGPAGPLTTPVVGAPAGLTGQAVPGPIQLEGVQAPQLAVEKRGPKEIQVGKPARYEVVVRNVGSATAHEVLLRDAVPKGTSLIATTPPASPVADGSESSADLVWALGVLPPGGEARVLMELMPESEGEVGSVASVSFRADATLRARATKPQLTIDCVQPQPVRIGGDVQVTITVSNPGSGDATGVVLEAFLPETVSHRAGRELEFDVGRLRPGDAKTIDLVLGTSGPGSQPAQFVARADGGIEVDRPLPIAVTAPTLDVSIDMPARRFLQRPATCSIAMLNAGTASARSVELAAQLPVGMKFVRANNAGWHDERAHRVLWNLEELPAGDTGVVEVVVMPVQAGEQRIAAAARSADGPSDQAVHVCQVEGLAALAFQVGDSEDPIEVQGVAEYVVRVANEGTKAATGVRLAATLLGDLEPVEADGPGRHRIENLAVEFEPLAKLGPGEEVVYRIRARGRRSGHQRVQVQLASEDTPTPITKEEVTSFYDDR
ncbi:MAG: DUF11 domain-containing protein [Planctomycetes bacterium]|nr:DUF11 domain-containing protein [Planctomycetota bacterium]